MMSMFWLDVDCNISISKVWPMSPHILDFNMFVDNMCEKMSFVYVPKALHNVW